MKFIVATSNEHKMNEFRQILKDTNIKLISQKDLKINIDIVEDGDTYAKNALIKAKTIYELTKIPTIADDSGLEIEALDNFPGVYSARYEEGLPYCEKNRKILDLIKDKENRNAAFKCVICVVGLEKEPLYFEGEFKGEIAKIIIGNHGFGYDPIFYYPPLNMTAAMMLDEVKNKYSHRGIALNKFKEWFNIHQGEFKND